MLNTHMTYIYTLHTITQHARWVRQRGRPGTTKCTPREGHTLVAWGPQQVGLCFGGFSQTPDKQYVIHDDVHMLVPGLPGRSPRWQPLQTVGRAPSPWYATGGKDEHTRGDVYNLQTLSCTCTTIIIIHAPLQHMYFPPSTTAMVTPW